MEIEDKKGMDRNMEQIEILVYGTGIICASCVNAPSSEETASWLQSLLSRKYGDKIAVCYIDGEFTVKRIQKDKNCIWLVAENKKYKPIKVTADNDFVVWGVVTCIIKSV